MRSAGPFFVVSFGVKWQQAQAPGLFVLLGWARLLA